MSTQAIQLALRAEDDPTPECDESRKWHVLVAEDDPDMRRLIAGTLRSAGHKVVEARDGMDILDRLEGTIWSERSDLFDVIVSDVSMPGLSGLDVLAALRCARWNTPVVLITAYGDEEMRTEARSLGAAAFIEKPFNPGALRAAVVDAAGHPSNPLQAARPVASA